MALRARTLHVIDYRNFPDRTLELAAGITVLTGRNAVGKTNLIEALQLMTAARSFRRPAPSELVAAGAEAASLDLTIEGDGRRIDVALEVLSGRRVWRRDGKPRRASGIRGVLPSVLFTPDDLDMVKRSAGVRRAAIDEFGSQLNGRYGRLVTSYGHIVEQRNALLRSGSATSAALGAWDESLTAVGSALLLHRLALLRRVRTAMSRIYGLIAPLESLDIQYRSSICTKADLLGNDDVSAREMIVSQFLRALEAARDEEHRRALSVVGPHRDEIVFSVEGRDARAFASQGQQRSLVLAWKIAEVEVTRDILGHPPLLLLDDVMSELDAERRSAVLRFVGDEIQTVISTTNLGYFSDEMRSRAKVVSIRHDSAPA